MPHRQQLQIRGPGFRVCTYKTLSATDERDTETGNDDFGARYYSNRFGRWLSADRSSVPVPVPYANLTNPQTLNLYSMVSDDPETSADLDGHQAAGHASEGVMYSEPTCTAQGSTGGSMASGCGSQAPNMTQDQQAAAAANQQAKSPYQKYMDEQNRPITEADKANALKQAGQMGDAGVKAGLVVVGAEAAVAGAVVAAPAVGAAASQAGAAINTATTSAYVQATTALSAAGTAVANTANQVGTAINNAGAVALDRTKQAIVASDTNRSGGGGFKAAGDFAQGVFSKTSMVTSKAGIIGRTLRIAYELGNKLF